MPDFERVNKSAPKKRKKKKKSSLYTTLIPCKGDSRGDIIRKVVLLAAIVILAYALISIIYFYTIRANEISNEMTRLQELKQQNHTDDVISVVLNDDDDGGSGGEEVQILSEYLPFYEQNSDFVGWVSMYPYIDYPVVQTTDNDYYLKHNFYKAPTENGTIFADYEGIISADSMPGNTILYGHNLITRNYFEPLTEYQRQGIDFLKENYIIDFDTLYQRGKYVIFSVFLCNTDEQHGEVFDYQNDVYFKNKAEFNDFVAECLDRSMFYTGVDLQYGDQLLTLSTCNFSMFSDMRLVVVARKLRTDESLILDTETFIDNTGFDENGNVKRKMFEAYYETYGCQWAGRSWDTSWIKDYEG